jgi:DNA adenine methylase
MSSSSFVGSSLRVKSLKPPFCRQGNKYMIRREIMAWFPSDLGGDGHDDHDGHDGHDDVSVYVELFAGSAALFFNLEKTRGVKYVLNDLDRDMIGRFRLLKKAPLDGDYRHDLNTLPKLKKFYSEIVEGKRASLEDLVLFEKVRTCNGFSGKPVGKPEEIYRHYNPDSLLKDLPEYKRMLSGVVLSNKDYEDVVEKYDSVHAFFFIDPPYEGTAKASGYSLGSKDFDYERLAAVVRRIRGRFLMTLNDSRSIRRLFQAFHIVKLNVYTTWGNSSGGADRRKELIIMNY